MKFKILSDSTCDLPQSILEQYDITLVPLTVVKEDRDYKDGVTITPLDIFAHVDQGGELCSTSAVSVGEYADIFAEYSQDYDGVLLVNLGSGFSSSYQNACVAASDFDNVRCVDSMSLSVGQGLLVVKACQLAKDAASLNGLAESLESYVPKAEGSFLLDQLKYLAKGGRCSSATALGANLLNLKPYIELKDGKMAVGKRYRGNFVKCLVSYVKEKLGNPQDIDTSLVFLAYTADLGADVLDPVRDALKECEGIGNIVEATAGCTISCHCGPRTLGVMYLKK